MLSPFSILDLDESATDNEIKKAYLIKVREHTPELDPRGFKKIRFAFETIKTEKDRLRYRLFHYGQPDLDLVDEQWLSMGQGRRPSKKMMIDMLTAAVKGYRINRG